MDISVQSVILSGGSGTRLWPLSREAYPKQFWPLVSTNSLLADTALRIDPLDTAETESVSALPPIVVCNEAHRFLVAEQLREAGFENTSILLEPCGRNTAPALTLAALSTRSDPVLVVLPSDHLIRDEEKFRALLRHAAKIAADGRVVTFGIVPTRPETGFGYLLSGAPVDKQTSVLDSFVEKPGLKTAEAYVSSGKYLWNSGIFVMRASVWLREAGNYCSDILHCCEQAMNEGSSDGPFFRPDNSRFSTCRSESIDTAVMEEIVKDPERNDVCVMPMDVGWSDLGSWGALMDCQANDEHGNVKKGDVYAFRTRDSLVYAQSRFVATVGVSDTVVIETADAVLVANRDNAQDIKKIAEYLKESRRSEHVFHNTVHKPWGNHEHIDQGDNHLVKRLTVYPGASLTLQMHQHRSEHWIVVNGTARITRGNESFLLHEHESTFIPAGEKHSLANPGDCPLEIIEVQSGSELSEDDIVRY